jgi:alpha-galactosidase
MSKMVRDYNGIRDNYVGDFFPLSSYELSEERDVAWQFDRPDLGTGIVQAFRRPRSRTDSMRLKLRELVADATYLVTDIDHPEQMQALTGAHLMNVGLNVRFPDQPCAVLITYKKKE